MVTSRSRTSASSAPVHGGDSRGFLLDGLALLLGPLTQAHDLGDGAFVQLQVRGLGDGDGFRDRPGRRGDTLRMG
jgi:hypothetical protein